MAGLDPAIYVFAEYPHGGRVRLHADQSSERHPVCRVTNDLVRRIFEHRSGFVEGFTRRYGLKKLVYFERHETIRDAIQREHNIKHWSRTWKVRLIVATNPDWDDLYETIVK